MSIIKSFSVDCGDMFYIKHGSDNFTIIDCNLSDRNEADIVDELIDESKDKGIKRFISTHPDEDHICGITYLDERMGIGNFYCVKNEATKKDPSKDFIKYCELRDSEKAFHIQKDCSRKWMNISDDDRGGSGINILWPDINNPDYKEVLSKVKNGDSPNNTSAIIKYGLENGVTALWMGDLEKDFMEKIEDYVDWPSIDILFAPHHGRKSGKIPKTILDKLKPKLIVIGEAASIHLDYYDGYNKMTQNSTGDILFECVTNKVHVHVRNETYSVNYLDYETIESFEGLNYIGTLNL
ncbi:hypothetical protein [Pseudalkalibacillus hwajinpoensis]|uniref:MBL fold metallo-hydrolase n=1 Tax=Guptibacillus hwajinpoensis TaxID=208199 RepID=A0A4U1M8G3_9BACL|nr:hypothetical protein [Pseudalkalibacillus hwajinpoensis]TKD66454.1 hypothetical protein FBF83_20140 [Pseudalkalibacillus hwajinpoensis]